MLFTFLIRAVSMGTVLLYGCMGEMLMEKSGHLNLGVPGIMCMGAAGAYLGTDLYMNKLGAAGNPHWILLILFSFFFSVLLSVATGAIYAFLTVTLRCNQNITGLAVTTFGTGLSELIMSPFLLDDTKFKTTINVAGGVFSRGIVNDPNANGFLRIFFSYGIFVYLAIAMAIVFAIILKRTRLGLHLRSVGENPAAADADGINVTGYKYGAILIGSALAGLGGLFYTLEHSKSWEGSSTMEGFGWLAIALVIFTLWKPNLAILGSILFGGLSIAAFVFNGIDSTQKELLKLLPYVITVLVLVITSIRKKRENQPPASLGLSYFREER